MKPNEYADTKKIRSCIECLSCISACPVVPETSEFAGPYFMRYISKFAMDPGTAKTVPVKVLMKDFTAVHPVENVEKYVQRK
jgi:succinate dehydrogenase/fumarate reductase-like Fe-S protein